MTPGAIQSLLCLTGEAAKPSELIRVVPTAPAVHVATPVDSIGAERMGVVTHHLFARKSVGGLLPLATLDERSIANCLREIRQRRGPVEPEADDEGFVEELQAW